ncbi:MAG: DUF1501 domain-containing protein [Pirellulales bacterium]
MLTFFDHGRGLGRREFLRLGAWSLAGLPWAARSAAAAAPSSAVRDRSVVLLFLHGGPSQIETFDPKGEAPSGIRSVTGEIATSIPGVTFGGSFPRLARLADRLAIVRSFVPGDANHDIKPVVHRETLGANLGSIYARVAGVNNAVTGLPTNALLFPQAVDPETQPGEMSFGRFGASGPFGAAYAPFEPGAAGTLQEDLKLKLPRDRLDDRRRLLSQLDALRRRAAASDALTAVDRLQGQAFEVILRGVGTAFDLNQEDPRTVARYDTAPLVRPENISRHWNNHRNYADNARSLGKLLLLARRLCESGCGFVTVTTNFVWDMHADVNNAPMGEGMSYMGPPLDHAVSAFLEDVAARGLSDKILLVVCGEMGRTPKLNAQGGRDHWGNLGPLLLAGGGLPMGQIIGRSSRDGGEPAGDPVSLGNLIATIMHTLFDPSVLRLQDNVPRDIVRLVSEGTPIRQLVG